MSSYSQTTTKQIKEKASVVSPKRVIEKERTQYSITILRTVPEGGASVPDRVKTKFEISPAAVGAQDMSL